MSIKEKREEIKGGDDSEDYPEEEFDIVPRDSSRVSSGGILGHVVNISLVVLVASLSFGLGRLGSYEESRVPVRIIAPQGSDIPSPAVPDKVGEVKGVATDNISLSGEVVASKSGSKYHLPWCPGAKQISEKNKIIFSSIDEARKAGYLPASNCKGLK